MKSGKPGLKVLVIGAGLGGISAAISLATEGFEVELFEKNPRIGGKLNLLERDGFRFDLGPSIIILPHLFRRLFERAGRTMEEYVQFQRLEPQWRSFFEDGTVIDLCSDVKLMERELEKLGEQAAGYWDFVSYSRMLFKFAEQAYMERGSDTLREIMRGYGWLETLRKTDLFSTMDQGVSRHIKHPHLKDMLNFFIKYVGSSPYDAPAIMNLLAYSQLGYGLWYVSGGMYNLAVGLDKLMEELGIQVHLGCEVTGIQKSGDRVTGLVLVDGQQVSGDVIVSNMEVIPAYKKLLQERGAWLSGYEHRYEPAASGLVVHLGVDRKYPQLAHHNFFFARDPKLFLHTIHRQKRLPEDPTIYVVCPTRTDPDLAPEGHEIIKLLPHLPYLQDPPFPHGDYLSLKERLYDKLERMGLADLRKHIVVEDLLTPDDLHRMYYSNKGAIYGVVSSWKRNLSLKAPKRSSRYKNLYFVGGSVNPGGGTPMVILCGQLVGDLIVKNHT
ncbi:MAG: phytoene desaturase [Bradymonadales bacterium]|nr:phytoene desaturase [Bradymonadales bacterium]